MKHLMLGARLRAGNNDGRSGGQFMAAQQGDKKMKDFKVTVTGETSSISYEVRKTAKGAESFGKKVAAEAFYGEICTITVVEIA